MKKFRSKFEASLAKQMKLDKIKADYETLDLPYTLRCVYTPDFILANKIIVEAKGVLDAGTRRKMVAVKSAHPRLDIRFVFMRASNRINGSRSSTYGEWATKNGFKWAEGRVPLTWSKEII